MKIGIISTIAFRLPPAGYAGLEQLAWQHAVGLAARGHEVTVFAPDGSHCAGCKMVYFGQERTCDEKTAYSRFWQHLPACEVIIDHSWQAWSHKLKMEGRLPAPILKVCHAPINTMFQEIPPAKVLSFVCISKDQADHFKAIFSRDCRWVHNGVDTNFYQPIPGLTRTKRFLFLARFSSIKGPHLAIEACRKAGVGLDLVGDTSITQEPDYFKQCVYAADEYCAPGSPPPGLVCKENDPAKRIRIYGNASRGECVHRMSRAHCMLHPNRDFREPFGLAPVESMLCGCPVIGWDNGAMRETLPAELLVRTEDELTAAIKLAAAYEFDRPRLREHALQFSVEKMIDGYENLCKEAVTKGAW